jgi:hypothetical protein
MKKFITKLLGIKLKVQFYLSGGQILTIYCTDIDVSKLSGTKGKRTLDITGGNKRLTIDMDEVTAITFKQTYFKWN